MASSTRPTTVLIVGGGIVGPALALLLKQKGYQPTIVEKVRDLGEAGLAIALQPNGMKVLNRVGIAADLVKGTPAWESWDEFTSGGEFLGGPGSLLTGDFADKYGWPCIGVSRTRLQTLLLDICRRNGIEIRNGWRLAKLREDNQGVVARSEGGEEIRADFLVGADGLKSRTRELLLKKRGAVATTAPDFTGIAVLGGASPTPETLGKKPGVKIWYGATMTIINHPLENGMSVWGLTYAQDKNVDESWRTIAPDEVSKEIEATLDRFKDWVEPVRELIAGTRKMMTIGLYDRPELPVEHWYHGKCILVGDAAHPGTPHIGQGASQGLEDCWHLAQLLPPCDEASTKTLSTEELEGIFHRLASIRQGPTTQLVKRAREQGQVRVVTEKGEDAWKKRDDLIRATWKDVDNLQRMYDALYSEPFEETHGYDKWGVRYVFCKVDEKYIGYYNFK